VNDLFQNIPRQDDPEDDPLMEVLQDVLDNGGPVPDEVTPRLIMGAVRSTYRATIRGLNTSRRNQVHLWALTAVVVGGLLVLIAIRHNDLAVIGGLLGVPLPIFP
jgi:hypothetical protein